MSLHILAVLTDAATAAVCLDAAAATTRDQPDATLRALYVDVDPDRIVAAPEEVDFQRMREAREGTATARRDEVEAAFADWRAAHPRIPLTLTVRVGEEQAVLVDEASATDLVVLAQAHNLDNGDALHAAAFSLEVPMLVVPTGWRARSLNHIVIAWSGSEAAERAVNGALPWLEHADTVTILTIGEDVSAQRVREDLGLGGIHAMIEYRARGEGTLGEQLATLARELGAIALVAGAYRHNAVIEWLVGGTTRHLLDHAELPLFLAH